MSSYKQLRAPPSGTLSAAPSHLQLVDLMQHHDDEPSSSYDPPSGVCPSDLTTGGSVGAGSGASPRLGFVGGGKGTLRWYRRLTGRERILLLSTLLLAILCLALSLLLVSTAAARPPPPNPPDETVLVAETTTTTSPTTTAPSTSPPPPSICTTAGCVRAANNLLDAMNESADPCVDFFEYACGSWVRAHPIPDDLSQYGTFAHVRELVRTQMRVLLESPQNDGLRATRLARVTYQVCMNTTRAQAHKSTELLAALQELGDWPALSARNDTAAHSHDAHDETSRRTLSTLLARLKFHYSADVLFVLGVYADARNTSRHTLMLDQMTLSLGKGSRDYYLNDTMFSQHIDIYQTMMSNVIRILAKDAGRILADADVESDVAEIVSLERRLAAIVTPDAERRNSTRMYNRYQIAELHDLLPEVDWHTYLEGITEKELHQYIGNQSQIIISEPAFFKALSSVLSSTSPRLLTNYIFWRFVSTQIRFLDDRFEDAKQDLVRVMTGQEAKSARWKDCAALTPTLLPHGAGALYIHAHFAESSRNEAREMVAQLRESFIRILNTNDWMDERTKVLALEKANTMRTNIGYPDLLENATALDAKYADLDVAPEQSFFELMRKMAEWNQREDMKQLAKPFDKNEFDVSAAVVNAYYAPEKNSITFPAGILQPPFFSAHFPKAVNYGAMGATHGFDDQGRQYDVKGELRDWWSPDSASAFEQRRECIEGQYSALPVPGTRLKVNGRLTQGENIADNGGIKEAYLAYRAWVSKSGEEEPRLAGLQHLTNDQIFFLSYAHFWCGSKKPAAAVQQALTDEHAPDEVRVRAVLANLDAFGAAFGCAPGSPMRPHRTCHVW